MFLILLLLVGEGDDLPGGRLMLLSLGPISVIMVIRRYCMNIIMV